MGEGDRKAAGGRQRSRPWLGLAAALIPAVPILVALLITSGGASAATGIVGQTRFAPVAPGPAAPTPAELGAIPQLTPPGTGQLVAAVLHATAMRTAPAGRLLRHLPTRTEFGSREVLAVVELSPGWLGVLSPLAGNGRVGWIPETAARLERVAYELRISLSARRLTVLEGSNMVHSYTIAIGRPSAPTPTGRFAVTDRLSTGDPAGPYGCCVIALSALSPHAIQGWGGGNRIAIHSTPDTASIGQAVSHGCMRLTLAEGQWLLDHVPLGTPTLITS